MTTIRKIIIAVAAVLAVTLIVIAVILGLQGRTEKLYTSSLKSASNYYAEGKYEDAIIAYQEAIKAEPKDADAYIGLANTYTAMGDSSSALDTLEEGYGETHSISIKLMINDLEGGDTTVVSNALNHTLLTEFAGTSYGEYESSHGIEKETKTEDGVIVRVKSIAADYTYRNTDAQPEAVSNGKVNDDSMPAEIQMDEIMSIFGGGETITKEQIEELDVTDMIQTENKAQGTIIQFVMDGCQISIACDEDGTVHSGAWNKIEPMSTGELKETNKTTLHGSVMDASTGEEIEGVELSFRSQETRETESTVTSATGSYSINLEGGHYDVTLSKDGYTELTDEVYIYDYQNVMSQDFNMSSELASGEARIVLEWGAEPTDLDLHMHGQTDDGSNFYVDFTEMEARKGNDLKASLDLDDTSSYGPETITIYDLNGVYSFLIQDYTQTGNIEQFDFTVTVYLPGQSPQVIGRSYGKGVSSTPDGYNNWGVFKLDHGKIETFDGF